jgi:predicted metal-dependent hydrolase
MHLLPEEQERVRQGFVLFRSGDYFATHDAWEEVWQGLRGRRRLFWQAMIQLAVGAYHLRNGNHKGCQSQWSKALQKCDTLQPLYEPDIPEPLRLLTDLLHTCLTALATAEEPWPYLTAFAASASSEAWLTFE